MPIPFGRYQLLRKIASGGMGQVLLAKKGDEGFEKLVVIKRILPHLVEDEEFFTMFKDEAKITMRLDHPNIARINEFGVEKGVHFIEMEYVAGEDARRIEKRAAAAGRKVPVGVVVRIIADAAAGLDFAHKARDSKGQPLDLVHRDVSPQNVLVGFDGAVKLIDFGVAKAAGRAQHTATGILKGKFPYMSPEQARGDALDARSDIFALGIILWELLTSRRLFKGENDLATQKMVLACQVPAPSSVEPSVPKALDAVVLKALAERPEARYADAAAFRMALEDFAREQSLPASSAHLATFMQELYAERIEREADPRSLEEDSGLTDLDVGGLVRHGAAAGAQARGGEATVRERQATQALARPGPGGGRLGLVALVVGVLLAGAAGIYAFATRDSRPASAAVAPPVEVQPPAEARPVEAAPVQVRVDSQPSGAEVELAGRKVGQTPWAGPLAAGDFPVRVRVSYDGYEAAEGEVTATSPAFSAELKKVARPQRPGPKSPAPIKTTR